MVNVCFSFPRASGPPRGPQGLDPVFPFPYFLSQGRAQTCFPSALPPVPSLSPIAPPASGGRLSPCRLMTVVPLYYFRPPPPLFLIPRTHLGNSALRAGLPAPPLPLHLLSPYLLLLLLSLRRRAKDHRRRRKETRLSRRAGESGRRGRGGAGRGGGEGCGRREEGGGGEGGRSWGGSGRGGGSFFHQSVKRVTRTRMCFFLVAFPKFLVDARWLTLFRSQSGVSAVMSTSSQFANLPCSHSGG